jgi:hypothetical protein
MGKNSQATDLRDHVYGVLGLTNTSIIPDYAKDDVQLYHDFVSGMLQDIGRVEWLRYSGKGSFERNTAMPSWMPNFPGMSLSRGMTYFGYNKPADQDIFPGIDSCPLIKDHRLFVSGILGSMVDKIQEGLLV